MQILVRDRPTTVPTDTVKPAYMLNETDRGTSTFNPTVDATPAVAPPSYELHAPAATYIYLLASTFELPSRGGGMMGEPPKLNEALQRQHTYLCNLR
jgi:hypothetical protein